MPTVEGSPSTRKCAAIFSGTPGGRCRASGCGGGGGGVKPNLCQGGGPGPAGPGRGGGSGGGSGAGNQAAPRRRPTSSLRSSSVPMELTWWARHSFCRSVKGMATHKDVFLRRSTKSFLPKPFVGRPKSLYLFVRSASLAASMPAQSSDSDQHEFSEFSRSTGMPMVLNASLKTVKRRRSRSWPRLSSSSPFRRSPDVATDRDWHSFRSSARGSCHRTVASLRRPR
mmetsp:Transcript_70198/g.217093  ORF Transcript_70198/g.217093 Transcript_70198/m.217093 type:complete len:226 (-) Transcript_70198:367-1044(-)